MLFTFLCVTKYVAANQEKQKHRHVARELHQELAQVEQDMEIDEMSDCSDCCSDTASDQEPGLSFRRKVQGGETFTVEYETFTMALLLLMKTTPQVVKYTQVEMTKFLRQHCSIGKHLHVSVEY